MNQMMSLIPCQETDDALNYSKELTKYVPTMHNTNSASYVIVKKEKRDIYHVVCNIPALLQF